MDPITVDIVTSLAVNYFSEFSIETVKKYFGKAIEDEPEIEDKLQRAKTSRDFEEIFKESSSVIDFKAGSEGIDVSRAFIEAIQGINFDHGNGQVTIQGSTMNAPMLVTGGSVKSTGMTTIGENTQLKSRGTSITVGKGGSIRIGGDSQIRQD